VKHCSSGVGVFTLAFIVALTIVVIVATLYFLGVLMFSSTASGEYVMAQKSLMNFANILQTGLNVKDFHGSTTLSTWHGDVVIRNVKVSVSVYFDNTHLTIYNGSTCSIIYYAGYMGGGVDIHGRSLIKGEERFLKGSSSLIDHESVVDIVLGYDENYDRWYVKLAPENILLLKYGSSNTTNHYTAYMLILKHSQKIPSGNTITLKFRVYDVIAYAIPSGRKCMLNVKIDGKSETIEFTENDSLTVIVTLAELTLK